MAQWFWLRIFHEVTDKMSAGTEGPVSKRFSSTWLLAGGLDDLLLVLTLQVFTCYVNLSVGLT